MEHTMRRLRVVLFLLGLSSLVFAGSMSVYAGPLPLETPMLPLVDDSLPGWAIPLVIAGVVAIAAIIYLLGRRREE
jgi:hypothetical protein